MSLPPGVQPAAPVLTVGIRRITLALLACAVGLVVLSILLHYGQRVADGHDAYHSLRRAFLINGEGNIPAAYSVALLGVASLLLLFMGQVEVARRGADVWSWRLLALGFAYLAFDEGAQIHERLEQPARSLLGNARSEYLYFAWVIPAAILLPLVGALFFGFLRRLDPATRRGMLLAAAIYLGGALGMEVLGGRHLHKYGNNTVYRFYVSIEESMEMGGVILLLNVLLTRLARVGPVLLCVAAGPRRTPAD
jgi:hypothetical protein